MINTLIIEDDTIYQIKLESMIGEFGYKTFTATHLSEAQNVIDTNQIDVIITDIILPDGLAIDHFKSNPPQCPIIFVTEVANKNFVDKVVTIPFASFFIKPFHSLTLLSAIQFATGAYNKSQTTSKTIRLPVRYGQTTDVDISVISWIVVEGNYSSIKTPDRIFTQKLSFAKIIPYLDQNFLQIHKSTIINLQFLENYNLVKNTVTVQSKSFSIGRSFRKKFIDTIFKVYPK